MTAAEDEEIGAEDWDVGGEGPLFSDWPSCSRIGVTWPNKVSMCKSLVSSSWTYLDKEISDGIHPTICGRRHTAC